MPDRSRSQDENDAAVRNVREATGDDTDEQDDPFDEKNPAAVELGRLGGLKGGPARAKKLSKERRVEIARKAAEARWKDRDDSV